MVAVAVPNDFFSTPLPVFVNAAFGPEPPVNDAVRLFWISNVPVLLTTAPFARIRLPLDHVVVPAFASVAPVSVLVLPLRLSTAALGTETVPPPCMVPP